MRIHLDCQHACEGASDVNASQGSAATTTSAARVGSSRRTFAAASSPPPTTRSLCRRGAGRPDRCWHQPAGGRTSRRIFSSSGMQEPQLVPAPRRLPISVRELRRNRADADGRRLQRRLAGDCIACRSDRLCDRPGRRVFPRPMHRRKDFTATLRVARFDARQQRAVRRLETRKRARHQPERSGVERVDCHHWLRCARGQLRHAAGAGHGAPLIAHATGVQHEL
jgi:hypothetical protein